MTIKEIQEEIIDEFSMFDDWMERYEYMIELGKSLPIIDQNSKTEDNLIKGCQSKVWVDAKLENDKIVFILFVIFTKKRLCIYIHYNFIQF